MSDDSRVLIISERNFKRIVPMTYWYEYEDVISAIDRADIVAVDPARKSLASRIRHIGVQLGRRTRLPYRPLAPMELDHNYELLFVISAGLHGGLECLDYVRGWETRCRVKILYSHEMWAKQFKDNLTSVRRNWSRFDHVVVGFPGTTDVASKLIGRECSFHSGAVDAFRFCPTVPCAERPIDVANIGRCSTNVHLRLLEWAGATDRWYEYDSTNSCNVFNYIAHRSLLAERLKRTKYFVANPAQFNNPALRGTQEEIAMRHFEGAASGTVMIGQPPECDAKRLHFDWEDAIVPIAADSTEIVELIEELEASPQRTERIRIANVRQSLLRHDWSYRWRQILQLAGLAPTGEHIQREAELARRATALDEDTSGVLSTPGD